MKTSGQLLILATAALLVCGGCAKINLSKPAGSASATTGGHSSSPVDTKSPPPIEGDWQVTFGVGENFFDSNVVFSQQGAALAGKGQDQGGPFMIQNGSVNGTKVHFQKKYLGTDMMGKEPVDYDGDLEYSNDPDYQGWKISGHYKAVGSDGKVIEDKWVAVNAAAAAQTAQAAQTASAPPPEPQRVEPQPSNAGSAEPPNTSKEGPNISRQYIANYEFNFHPVQSVMWLEQHNKQITGHGYDKGAGDGAEEFQIVRGKYDYPNLVLVWKYVKGKHAKASRELTIKTKVNSDLSMKGETQFGGSWDAKVVR